MLESELIQWALNNGIGVLFGLLIYFRLEKRFDKLINEITRINGSKKSELE